MEIDYAYAKCMLHEVIQRFTNSARSSYEASNISTHPYREIERYLQYLSLRLGTKTTNIWDDELMSDTERYVIKSLLDFFERQVNLPPSAQSPYPRLEALQSLPLEYEVFKLVFSKHSNKQTVYQHQRSWINYFSHLRERIDTNLALDEPANGAIAELAAQLIGSPPPQDLLDHAKRLNEAVFDYWSCNHVAPREVNLFLADFDQRKLTNEFAKFRILLSSAKGFRSWKWADVRVDTRSSRGYTLPEGSRVARSCKHSGKSPEQQLCICGVFERAGRLSLELKWVDADLEILILNVNRPKREELKISSTVSVRFEDLPSVLKTDTGHSVRASLNQLAVILAYTLLHLFDDNDSVGSWICTNWFGYYEDSNHSIQRWIGPDWISRVRFLYHNDSYSKNGHQEPDILRPYLCSRTSFEETPTFDEEARSNLQHAFPSLLALGIGLLKIQQMRAGEDKLFVPNEDDLIDGQPTVNSDLMTATAILDRLKNDSKSQLGVDKYFLEAIDACLRPDDYEISDGATRSQLRKYVREKVVTHLKLNSFITSPTPRQMECLMQGASLHDTSSEVEAAEVTHASTKHTAEAEDYMSDGGAEKKVDKERSHADGWCQKFRDEVLLEVHTRKKAKNVQSFRKVKVAILDTGLRVTPIKRKLWQNQGRVTYKSWVQQEDDSEWEDEVGHGTHSANLLVDFAPDAQVYVARVFRKQTPDDQELSYIAEAITHAVKEWEVDIISMSFGVEEAKSNEASREKISDALRFADSKNVIIFAAASNEGRNGPGEGIAWPAKSWEVISVHSASGKGFLSHSCPPPKPHGRAVCTLGESVESGWLPSTSNVRKSITKRKDGTSTATPIAAAIAAVVIDYADSMGHLKPYHKKKLRNPNGIFEVLRLMMADDQSQWLKPWEFFSGKDDQMIAKDMRFKLK